MVIGAVNHFVISPVHIFRIESTSWLSKLINSLFSYWYLTKNIEIEFLSNRSILQLLDSTRAPLNQSIFHYRFNPNDLEPIDPHEINNNWKSLKKYITNLDNFFLNLIKIKCLISEHGSGWLASDHHQYNHDNDHDDDYQHEHWTWSKIAEEKVIRRQKSDWFLPVHQCAHCSHRC